MKRRFQCLPPLLLAAVTTISNATPAQLDRYPERPIKFVVTYPPGGGTDIVARTLASEMAKELKQAIVVDNRAGAGGTIGTNEVAKAKPDGYTILFGTTAGLIINPLLKKDMPYDANRDFSPVSLLATTPQILVVNPSLPIKTTQELIAYAKQHPGQLNYASVGIGAPNHIAMEIFKHMTATDLTHVPYKGAGPVINDLLGNQVQVTMNPIPPMLSHLKDGKLRALAVTSHSAAAPNIPTIAQSGVPGYEANFWYGVFVPANTPAPIIDKLNKTIVKVMGEQKLIRQLTQSGVEPRTTTPRELGDIMKRDTETMRKTMRDAGIITE